MRRILVVAVVIGICFNLKLLSVFTAQAEEFVGETNEVEDMYEDSNGQEIGTYMTGGNIESGEPYYYQLTNDVYFMFSPHNLLLIAIVS